MGNKHLPFPVALTEGPAPLSEKFRGTRADSYVPADDAEWRQTRSQNLNLSKQPNLHTYAVMRDQSPSYPERQRNFFFAFWGLTISSSSLHFSKGFRNHPFHKAVWVSAEPLSNTEQTFSTTESTEKCIYLTPCIQFPSKSLSTFVQSPKAIKAMMCLRQRDQGCSGRVGNNTKQANKKIPQKTQMHHPFPAIPL